MAESARSIVNSFLAQFGLQGLGQWAFDRYVQVGGGNLGLQVIESELPDQPAFKARFPAYETLAKRGRAMTPAEMLAYERTAVQLFRAAGLPTGYYDQPQDLARLMENEISVAELQQRISLAQQEVLGFDAETKAALRDFYDITDGDLTAMALDQAGGENIALPLLQQRYAAAQIAGEGRRAGFELGRGLAEELVREGVGGEEARQTFGELAQVSPLFRGTAGEGEDIGVADVVGAGFGTRPEAARRVRQRQERRRADFGGSSGYGVREGVSGLGTA